LRAAADGHRVPRQGRHPGVAGRAVLPARTHASEGRPARRLSAASPDPLGVSTALEARRAGIAAALPGSLPPARRDAARPDAALELSALQGEGPTAGRGGGECRLPTLPG